MPERVHLSSPHYAATPSREPFVVGHFQIGRNYFLPIIYSGKEMNEADFQFVLEFDGDTSEHLLRTSSVEEALTESITTGQVDGRDIGGGCMNIFLFCAEPLRCFEEVLARLSELNYLPTAAGFRKWGNEAFIRVWPKGDATPFH